MVATTDAAASWSLPPTDLDWRNDFKSKPSIAEHPFDPRTGIAGSITDLVGNTPMVYLDKIARGLPGRLAAKLESFEPLGSIKDRIALSIIEDLEQQGRLIPGQSKLLEVTSGNTGIGLAFVAAAKGYQLKCVMPEMCSIERRVLMLALGAEVVLTPKEAGFEGVLAKAEELMEEDPSLIFTKQFENPANPWIHRLTTGPEIWRQTQGKVDVFMSGVGTGGTLTGVGSYLKEMKPEVQILALEPEESPYLSTGKAGKHGIEGIGSGLQPPTLDPAVMDDIITASTEEARTMARRLALEEGIFCGVSSGAAVAAAIKVAKRPESEGKLIVTVLPSFGERYLSTPLFQDYSDKARSLPVQAPQPQSKDDQVSPELKKADPVLVASEKLVEAKEGSAKMRL